jgi:ketosteroid isomerase-like protein
MARSLAETRPYGRSSRSNDHHDIGHRINDKIVAVSLMTQKRTRRKEKTMEDRGGQVRDFAQEWAAAERSRDTAFLQGALADDFVGIGPLGFMLTKDQRLERYAGGLSYESFGLDEVEARFYGDVAVATCRQSQSGEFQGNDVGGTFRATLVILRRENRWLLAGVHLSQIADAPSFLDR